MQTVTTQPGSCNRAVMAKRETPPEVLRCRDFCQEETRSRSTPRRCTISVFARARPAGAPWGGALRAFLARYGAPAGARPGLTLDALAARLQLPAQELEAYLDGPAPGWLRAALAGLAVAEFGEAPGALGWLLPPATPGDAPEGSG